MPQFRAYKEAGRELMVRFTCARCGRQIIEELNDEKIENESYGWLKYIKKPADWYELRAYDRLFCTECGEQFNKFLNNEPLANK